MSSSAGNIVDATVATTQNANWSGCIPVRLTLAPTSVSSPTIPPPVHVLVPRLTFLHTGLQSAVQRLHPFAPLSPFLTGRAMLQISEPDPERGGDSDDGDDDKPNVSADKKAQVDLHRKEASLATTDANTASAFVYPVCWFEDEDTKMAVRWHLFAGVLFDLKPERNLPWKLILHFTNYPESQILPLEHPVLTNVQASYKHSLKQAMTVASSNSRSAMHVTKESHGLLWEAVCGAATKFPLYQRVDVVSSVAAADKNPVAVPIRVLVNASNPPVQRRVDGGSSHTITLGRLLLDWLPAHFVASSSSRGEKDGDGDTTVVIVPSETVKCWRVSGIEPPLTTPIVDLWRHCSHPDHFLYIVVLTTTTR